MEDERGELGRDGRPPDEESDPLPQRKEEEMKREDDERKMNVDQEDRSGDEELGPGRSDQAE